MSKHTVFQTDIVKLLKGAGGYTFNIHGHAMQAAGWADLYVAHVLWTGWIEVKINDDPLRTLQEDRIRELLRRGENAIAIRLHSRLWRLEWDGWHSAWYDWPTRPQTLLQALRRASTVIVPWQPALLHQRITVEVSAEGVMWGGYSCPEALLRGGT